MGFTGVVDYKKLLAVNDSTGRNDEFVKFFPFLYISWPYLSFQKSIDVLLPDVVRPQREANVFDEIILG